MVRTVQCSIGNVNVDTRCRWIIGEPTLLKNEFSVDWPFARHVSHPCDPCDSQSWPRYLRMSISILRICSSCNQLPTWHSSPHRADVPLGPRRWASTFVGPAVMRCCARWYSGPSSTAALSGLGGGMYWIQYMQQGASALDAFC